MGSRKRKWAGSARGEQSGRKRRAEEGKREESA